MRRLSTVCRAAQHPLGVFTAGRKSHLTMLSIQLGLWRIVKIITQNRPRYTRRAINSYTLCLGEVWCRILAITLHSNHRTVGSVARFISASWATCLIYNLLCPFFSDAIAIYFHFALVNLLRPFAILYAPSISMAVRIWIMFGWCFAINPDGRLQWTSLLFTMLATCTLCLKIGPVIHFINNSITPVQNLCKS